MKATDVFTPQRIPTVTLVIDHLASMKADYVSVIEEGGKLIRVVGPSKSGKTVFLKGAVGEADTVPVTGAGVQTPDDLWVRVLHAIGSDTGEQTTRSESRGTGQKFSGEVEGSVLVAKGKVTGEVNRDNSSQASLSQIKAVDLLQKVISDLKGTGLTVFIDDFHYVPAEVQKALAKQLKQAVEAGVRVVAAAVPFRSEDALRANDDLQGRIKDFTFKYWTPEELVSIPKLGFPELNIKCPADYSRKLALEAAGSPQLMQSLCLETCRELRILERVRDPVEIPGDEDFFRAVCLRVSASVDFTTTIKVMNDGPLTRGSPRKSYVLKDGTAADVYQIVVRAIGLDPPQLHFNYSDLQARVAGICNGDSPHFSDPCSYMAKLVNDRFTSDKIDWDAEQHLFSIRDPYLMFAIRWG